MARYLVTGGAGFIGSHLVDSLLQDGHNVTVIDDLSSGKTANLDPRAVLVKESVLNRSALATALEDTDCCFHLAAKPIVQDTIRDWKHCTEVNLLATINLFEAIAQSPGFAIPIVYASSCAVYGATGTEGVGLRESDPVDPQSPYAVDKFSCELHARAGGITRGLNSFGARFFNVFGERQDPRSPYSGVVSKFCESLRRGQPLTIFGDGEQTRDFIHVSDIVRLLRKASSEASVDAPVANFGTGTSITINNLAETLIDVSGTTVPINRKAGRPGEVRYSQANLDRLRELIQVGSFDRFATHVKELLV